MGEAHFREIAEVISSIADVEQRKQAAGWIGQVCAHINDEFNYEDFDWDEWCDNCDIPQDNRRKKPND